MNAEVLLPHDGKNQTGKVKARAKGPGGTDIGNANPEPILDAQMCVVEFPDGQEAEYTANAIAQAMYSQCDMEGNQFLLMECVTDHKRLADAVAIADKCVVVRGRRHLRRTTKGWKLCVRWKDGTTSWERLADLKESNPVEVAEYAVSRGLLEEAAFALSLIHI